MTKIGITVLRNTRKYRLCSSVDYKSLNRLKEDNKDCKAYIVGFDCAGKFQFIQEDSVEDAVRKACTHDGFKVMQNGRNIEYNVIGDYILYTDGSKMMRTKI